MKSVGLLIEYYTSTKWKVAEIITEYIYIYLNRDINLFHYNSYNNTKILIKFKLNHS